MNGVTVTTKIHFRSGRRSKRELHIGEQREGAAAGRVPRLSRLMALAIRIEGVVRDGVLSNYAAAELGHVTRARMLQITNLLNLAPDIQEAILFLPPVESGRDPITERHVRSVLFSFGWREQRSRWTAVLRGHTPTGRRRRTSVWKSKATTRVNQASR